jgi:hypothetical protein
MANLIKMVTSTSITELYERGWSQRRIARELDLDRDGAGEEGEEGREEDAIEVAGKACKGIRKLNSGWRRTWRRRGFATG